MTPTVKDARHTSDYRVWIAFSDGTSGEVDLQSELWGPVLEPLRDPALFAQVRADPELDTITWPNGADFAPEFLYELVKAATCAPHDRSDAAVRRPHHPPLRFAWRVGDAVAGSSGVSCGATAAPASPTLALRVAGR